jgi:hypothetical protein
MAATLGIDHVTLAWSRLEPLERALAGVGLRADYGGKHANRSTHMGVLGFDDGSYLELIAPFEPGPPMAWGPHMRGDAGPCAWAVSIRDAADLAAEADRLRGLGVAVRGPMPSGRSRPDGQQIAWEFAFVGEGEPGATLPFLIADRTPRELRVRPSAGVSGTELSGVALVVLGVSDLDHGEDLFRCVYGWPGALRQDDRAFGAALAHVPGTPVVLAAPPAADGPASGGAATPLAENWLARRIAQLGPAPCAYLLGTRDLAASRARLPLVEGGRWFGREIAWIDPARVLGLRLGVVGDA